MSVRRLASGHVLPDNPTWIDFPRSDGDSRHLPTNTTRIVDREGHVNFMRPVPLDEGTAINWRVVVGGQLAKRMGYPDGPTYVLRSFPSGYKLYDHNKGPATSPRHDPYLCGSRNVNRFRSINEFIPHALWLMTDPTMNRAECECKYCSKKPQRVVTDTLELPSAKHSSATPLPSQPKGVRRRPEVRIPTTKPYTATRRVPKPVRQLTGPDQAITPELDNDLRAAVKMSDSYTPRLYRKGELVWARLDTPIQSPISGVSIDVWPCIIEDTNVHSEAIPVRAENNVASVEKMREDLSDLYEKKDQAVNTEETAPTKPQVQHMDHTTRSPWNIRQWTKYTLKMLAIAHSYVAPDDRVLPYLAHVPSPELFETVFSELSNLMATSAFQQLDGDPSQLYSFDPTVEELDPARFSRAAAPFSLAIEIASQVARYWSPTHPWEYTYTVEVQQPRRSMPSASVPPSPQPAQGLDSLITQSMANNATDVLSRPSAQGMRPPVSTPSAVTEQRYQGLWWGTERIWTGELVRLKIARRQFAPDGTEVLYPPSGPSEATAAQAAREGVDPASLGASERGLFLRLEGLFVIDVTKEDGTLTKECRASGTLFELADVDWEERQDVASLDGPAGSQPDGSSGKGKGKERAHDEVTDNILRPPPIPRRSSGSSFMPGPSPLKPPPLPNPDPTVPADQTGSDTLSKMLPGKHKKRAQGTQHSHPILSTPYPLPEPPVGYQFRCINHPGYEVVLSLSMISGRYYPGILNHPLMVPVVTKAFQNPIEQGGQTEYNHLWALANLVPGVHQSMDPQKWMPSRHRMLQEADAEARSQLTTLWEEYKQDSKGQPSQHRDEDIEVSEPMDIDTYQS